MGCVTEDPTYTPAGDVVPGRQILDFANYEYICNPLLTRDYREIEGILDQYGSKGWKLAGVFNHQGSSYAVCFVK